MLMQSLQAAFLVKKRLYPSCKVFAFNASFLRSALQQKSEQPVFHLKVANCNLQEEKFVISEGCLSQAVALQVPSMQQFALEDWRIWEKRSKTLVKLVGSTEEHASSV